MFSYLPDGLGKEGALHNIKYCKTCADLPLIKAQVGGKMRDMSSLFVNFFRIE